ncbi:thiamin pyrophosphokinase 1-like [Artemia franciscana]|nr:hypothetical protein QYM36_004731 [Artemia franciscana]KAK2720942.1 hypothetical protein QYM36_004731 [Artemia franciscana]
MAVNTISDTWRVARGVVSYPLSMLHWGSMKFRYGVKEWHPMSVLGEEDPDFKMALFLESQPFHEENRNIILDLWKRAKLRACVDQGLIEWDHFIKSLEEADRSDILMPDIISGDFKSVDPDIISQYQSRGAKAEKREDRHETDLHHAVKIIKNELTARNQKINCGVAVVNANDRFDHTMAFVNELFQGSDTLEVPLYLLSNKSLTWRLPTGRHRIFLNQSVHKKWSSIIPVGQPAYVTTTGLRWNMIMQRLEFGGVISTSNEIGDQKEVSIECDRPVLFSMGLPSSA